MEGCPPADQLRGFASGIVSDDVAAAIGVHVGSCRSCRDSMMGFAKGSNNTAVPEIDVEARIGKTLGRYRVDRVLGMGGMGIVYAAWDPQLDRPVAIKVVHRAAADAAGRARLVREAQSLARLSHTNVCHVYDVGTAPAPEIDSLNPEGDVWVAMEMVDGSTLRDWVGGKSPQEILAVLLGAGEGISAAHAVGLIHRDIKPENVLVTHDGRPVVTDFGLARLDLPVDPSGATAAIDPLRTATNAIVGTPAYLAPEQLTGGTLDARVDQFAWAVMVWELLTGVRPFPAIPIVRLDAIIKGPNPHPSLTKALSAALAKGMAAAPRDRYASLRELMDAVRPAAAQRRGGGFPIAIAAGAAVLAVAATIVVWKLASSDEATQISIAPPPAVVPPPQNPAQPIEPPKPAIAAIDPKRSTEKLEVAASTAKTETKVDKKTEKLVAKVEPKPVVLPKKTEPDLEVAKGRIPGGPSVPVTPTPTPTPPTPDVGSGFQKAPAGALEAYLARYPYDKTRAVAVLDSFCRIPIDAAKPGPEAGRHGVADWGKVTRREFVQLKLGNRAHFAPMYEVKGFRGSYRFTADHWANTVGVMDAKLGQWVVLCVDQMSDLYDTPPEWAKPLATLTAMVPVSRMPRTDEIAKWNPLHISDLSLRRDGGYGKTSLDTSRRFLFRSKLESHEGGTRWDMSGWWMDVPANIKGANLVAAGKRLWFVVEGLTFEEQADGSKPRLVVRAVAVVDDLFP